MRLINGDCLEVMEQLSDEGVKVDLVLTDPPYGTTACKWDTIIPFDEMWDCLSKLTNPNTPILLFGSEPFSTMLRYSNIKNYKYDWIWEKEQGANFMLFKYQPNKVHEIISLFSKETHFYYPQKYRVLEFSDIKNMSNSELKKVFETRDYNRYGKIDRRKNIKNAKTNKPLVGTKIKRIKTKDSGFRYPKSVIKINKESNTSLHPTQKPVKLLEYLIKTYTNPGDLVLDFTMGSGSTGVACCNTGRDFIGIELDEDYFKIAENRIKESMGQSKLDVFNKNKVKV